MATAAEDRSQVRCGQIAPVMSSLRNAVTSLMHCYDDANIAALCRRFAAQPMAALPLLGIISNIE